MFGVVLVAAMQATDVLGLPVLTEVVVSAGAALARLAVALVIVVAGLLLAAVAARAIEGGTLPNRRLVALSARAAILFFTAALALRQAGLPAEIIAIAFGAVVGGIAVAVAVAVGVGGHPVAGRLLERLVASFERDASAEVGATSPSAAPATPAQPPAAP
jgi:hypothetical protein